MECAAIVNARRVLAVLDDKRQAQAATLLSRVVAMLAGSAAECGR